MNPFYKGDVIKYQSGVSKFLTQGKDYTVIRCFGRYVYVIDDGGNLLSKQTSSFILVNRPAHHYTTSTNTYIDDPAPLNPDCNCHKNTYKDPTTPHFSWCKNDSSKNKTARDTA